MAAELREVQQQAAGLRAQLSEGERARREAERKAAYEHAALVAQDDKMARAELGLPPAPAAGAAGAAGASSVALLAAKPAATPAETPAAKPAEKPPVVSLKNKIMMLGALAKARAQRAGHGAPAPAPHSPFPNPATPKIVLLKAKEAGAPQAKPAANGASYAAKDCNCEWAGADHDRDGRADGCNGGDDGSICWSACCSPASLLPPIFLQQQEARAADAAVSFLELGPASPSAESMPASESMQAKLDAVLASGVVTGIAAGTAPQETSATTAPSMFAAAAAALAAADPSAAAVTAAEAAPAAAPVAATSPLAAPLAGPVEVRSHPYPNPHPHPNPNPRH